MLSRLVRRRRKSVAAPDNNHSTARASSSPSSSSSGSCCSSPPCCCRKLSRAGAAAAAAAAAASGVEAEGEQRQQRKPGLGEADGTTQTTPVTGPEGGNGSESSPFSMTTEQVKPVLTVERWGGAFWAQAFLTDWAGCGHLNRGTIIIVGDTYRILVCVHSSCVF